MCSTDAVCPVAEVCNGLDDDCDGALAGSALPPPPGFPTSDERVVYALGEIKDVVTDPGLHFKLPPPFRTVSYIDKRLLTLDSTDVEAIYTAEKQRVVIDWYVRWRITQPTDYIRNVGLDEKAGANQGVLAGVVPAADERAGNCTHRAAEERSTDRVVVVIIRRGLVVIRLGCSRINLSQHEPGR